MRTIKISKDSDLAKLLGGSIFAKKLSYKRLTGSQILYRQKFSQE